MNKTNLKEIVDRFAEEKVISEELTAIIGDRFGRYSKYVIQDRALPDVRDGLKPVQRRILFALYRLRMFSNSSYKKSARAVGEVIGKYHPHGDTAVYDALVRMSQDFKILLPLIDIHGNNGSIDGDPAAAMRYTECRLSPFAELMLKDINRHTVGLVPNFDDEELEPVVLPAKFPAILINGTTGISSGYATDIPPHNPDEVMNAVIYRLENPNCQLADIMEIIKGPDFPTGGIVQGLDGIKQAFKTGRGKIIIQSKTEIVADKSDHKIIITEIPYEVNKSIMIRKMSDMLVAKEVDGVRAIRDESDLNGIRIVIEVRKDVTPEYILNFLFKYTDLQTTYNYNMVAIDQGRPVQMGLLDIIDAYILHQRQVITSRSIHELRVSIHRAEVLDGFLRLSSIMDGVIKTIQNSNDKRDAIRNLIINYDFTEVQAEAIVMLQLYRLTNTDIFQLKKERSDLSRVIENLEFITSNDTALLKVIKNELKETLKVIHRERITQIEHQITDASVAMIDLISKEEVMIIITYAGYIKRMSKKAFTASDGPTKLKEGDVISDIYEVLTTDTLIQFTDLGNYVYLPIHKIPESKHKELGYHISTLIETEVDEKIIFSFPVSSFEEDRYVLIATKFGLIKRIKLDKLNVNRYSKVLKATKLREGDSVVSADVCYGSDCEIVIATNDGFMNRYNADEVSIIEPASFGVKSIELKSRPHDFVVGAKYVNEKDIIVLLTNRGTIKRMRPEEINKGKKNNVGKMYLKVVKSNPHAFIGIDIIHQCNANSNLSSYIVGTNGVTPIVYTELRTATAESGRKMHSPDAGDPIRYVICRDNEDLKK